MIRLPHAGLPPVGARCYIVGDVFDECADHLLIRGYDVLPHRHGLRGQIRSVCDADFVVTVTAFPTPQENAVLTVAHLLRLQVLNCELESPPVL